MPHSHAVIELYPSSNDGVRVLLADDFAPWRSQLRSFLLHKTGWEILEACDGLEAVQKTTELHPDIILMDIRMPSLNGIEAAKRIRQLSQNSNIVFLTTYADDDMKAAAFEAGASAYVLKSKMTADLIPAVQAALRTRR